MLSAIIFLLVSRLFSTNTIPWENWKKLQLVTGVIIIILTSIFWGLHILLSEDPENPEKYSQEWNKDSILLRVFGILYSLLFFGTSLSYIYDITHGASVSIQQYAFPIILLLVFDVITPFFISHEYALSTKEIILDSILFILSKGRNGTTILFAFIFLNKYFSTVLFTIIILIIFTNIFSLIKEIFWDWLINSSRKSVICRKIVIGKIVILSNSMNS